MKHFLRVNLILLLLVSTTIVSAHTPLNTIDGNNNTPETALIINDPTKSWTLYEELKGVDYYLVSLNEGEELRVSLYVSIWGDEHFTPSLVVMGPDIVGDYEPTFDHPDDLGRANVIGERLDQPEYEPFTPTSYYYVASYSHVATAEGDYYLAVYSDDNGGKYGMALGYRETFTVFKWLKIPLDLIRIHLWEEQPLLLLFGPPVAALAIGLYYLLIMKPMNGFPLVLGRLSGVLSIASGVMTLTQMVVYLLAAGYTGSAILTLFFVIAQLGLGYIKIRGSVNSWITWIVLGLADLAFWAGWIIGSVLALSSGIIQRLDESD